MPREAEMRPEASTGRGGQGALPGRLSTPAGTPRRRAAPARCRCLPPRSRAALCFARRAYHAVEAAVEAADAKDPTLPNAPVEAADETADEAADAEDRLPLPLAPVEAADAAHP